LQSINTVRKQSLDPSVGLEAAFTQYRERNCDGWNDGKTIFFFSGCYKRKNRSHPCPVSIL